MSAFKFTWTAVITFIVWLGGLLIMLRAAQTVCWLASDVARVILGFAAIVWTIMAPICFLAIIGRGVPGGPRPH